ncbi:MAG: DedA family protein [Gemmatimonadota bacterium]
MEWLSTLLDWLASLPGPLLLGAMAGLAMVENIFPPIPADVLVAFGGLLAAKAQQSPWPVFLCVWGGNVSGAAAMFWLGRRYGSDRIEARYNLRGGREADNKVRAMHRKYGVAAFFLSRFVPGVRSVVPPVAGALRIPFAGFIAATGLASGLWYGAITWLAFRAGANWDALQSRISALGRGTAVGGAALLLTIGLIWWVARRRRAS